MRHRMVSEVADGLADSIADRTARGTKTERQHILYRNLRSYTQECDNSR